MQTQIRKRLITVLFLATFTGCYVDDARDNPDDPQSENFDGVSRGVYPAAPTDLAAVAMPDTMIALAWASNTAHEIGNIDGFKVERKENRYYKVVATVIVDQEMRDGKCCSFVDSFLEAGREYSYKVYAFKGEVSSERSNVAKATTPSVSETSDAPTNLVATAQSATQIDLTWNDNADDELGYYLESKIGAGGDYGIVAVLEAGVTSYNDTLVSASTEYFYRVYAFNLDGNSAYSNIANATTPP